MKTMPRKVTEKETGRLIFKWDEMLRPRGPQAHTVVPDHTIGTW